MGEAAWLVMSFGRKSMMVCFFVELEKHVSFQSQWEVKTSALIFDNVEHINLTDFLLSIYKVPDLNVKVLKTEWTWMWVTWGPVQWRMFLEPSATLKPVLGNVCHLIFVQWLIGKKIYTMRMLCNLLVDQASVAFHFESQKHDYCQCVSVCHTAWDPSPPLWALLLLRPGPQVNGPRRSIGIISILDCKEATSLSVSSEWLRQFWCQKYFAPFLWT